MNPLLIAQVGRSGGTWLSTVLRADHRWLVKHEDGGISSNRESLETVANKFHGRYCDITHLHNEIADLLPCRKAVILRDPTEVFLSYAARSLESRVRFIYKVDGMYAAIDRMIRSGAILIHFERMVSSRDYCGMIFGSLGFDLDWSEASFEPVNKKKGSPPMPDNWVPILHRRAMQVWDTWKC